MHYVKSSEATGCMREKVRPSESTCLYNINIHAPALIELKNAIHEPTTSKKRLVLKENLHYMSSVSTGSLMAKWIF